MEAIDPLTIVNILMTCGIVVTMIALRFKFERKTKALHEQRICGSDYRKPERIYSECARSYL